MLQLVDVFSYKVSFNVQNKFWSLQEECFLKDLSTDFLKVTFKLAYQSEQLVWPIKHSIRRIFFLMCRSLG